MVDAISSLQKQIGCFNHRGFTLVEETVVMRGLVLELQTNCIRQLRRQLP